MRSAPLFVAGILFVSSGVVMVVTNVAGGFVMIPLGVIVLVRGLFLAIGARRKPPDVKP